MNTIQILLGVSVLTPLLGAAIILLLKQHPQIRNVVVLTVPFITLISVCFLAWRFFHLPTDTQTFVLFTLAPNLPISFMVEPIGILFACVVAFLWPVSMLYTLTYLYTNKLQNKTRFCACFSIAIGCTFGIAFAGDLLCLLIFYEALTFSTYPLVTHTPGTEARRAGRIYLGFLAGTSILLLLPAVIWIWTTYGNLQFSTGGILPADTPVWLLVLLVLGVGKMALMPLHHWLPAAMVAPPPVSALLHAVAVVKAGVFTLAKILVYIFGFSYTDGGWLVYVAGISVIAASLIAVRQDNLKLRLAYSTVSHLGYITMGLALLKPAIVGALLHLSTHALSKITLFFAAGAIQSTTGKKYVSELGGIGYQMPWTMACFAIAAVALIGLPPTLGFWSKWYLLNGALSVEHYFVIIVLIISTLLNAAYLIPVILSAFSKRESVTGHEAPVGMIVPMVLPVIMLLLLFVFPELILDLTQRLL